MTSGAIHAMIAQAHAAHPELSIRRLRALFDAGRTWYYVRPTRPDPAARDVALRDAIERLVLECPGYGYRRVTHALAREGWEINHKRVLRVMREESLLCRLKRGFVVTTDSQHGLPTYPNLLAGLELRALDQAWVADLTYIRLSTAFVYLATLLDAYSRRCVGWALSRDIDTGLTLTALDHALAQRQPAPGFVHHSDRGVQYASAPYVARLKQAGAEISMSARGNPYDNAKAESFFKTLKREEVYLNNYQTFAEAKANLGRFIEDAYNRKRLHSSLGYVPRRSSRRRADQAAIVDFAAGSLPGVHSTRCERPQLSWGSSAHTVSAACRSRASTHSSTNPVCIWPPTAGLPGTMAP
jgi:putative transposase